MKIKQLVIFSILNYIFQKFYTISKTELYDHDKKLFYDVWLLILTTNTNNRLKIDDDRSYHYLFLLLLEF